MDFYFICVFSTEDVEVRFTAAENNFNGFPKVAHITQESPVAWASLIADALKHGCILFTTNKPQPDQRSTEKS